MKQHRQLALKKPRHSIPRVTSDKSAAGDPRFETRELVANRSDLGTPGWASAEELAEPVLLFPAAAIGVAVALRFMVAVTGVAVTISVPWLRWRGLGHRAFDNFVEFAAVKPYSATFRAVVDFDSAAV